MDIESILHSHFGYDSFREGQKEVIQDVLEGKDVLGILPTGSGKSICYQLPARILKGVTIVVSPLISLMIDQVKQLKANGFKDVIAINSFLHPEERNTILRDLDQYSLIYVSPELLQQQGIRERLERCHISLFVVDEAHCISQWGQDFRPDYLKISPIIKRLGNPPVLALSATATPEVQQDIGRLLGKQGMNHHIHQMDRTNIAFYVEEADNEQDKKDQLLSILAKYHVPTLIYFTSRLAAENTAIFLDRSLQGKSIAFHHGGMDQTDRIIIQQQFMNGQLDIICCTSAFGMGINKQDIRLIIHYHLPVQLESFIQEVGRAGRDGKESTSVVLYTKADYQLPGNMIRRDVPEKGHLYRVVNDFSQLEKEDSPVPFYNEATASRYEISETQWNYLIHQLEKQGVIHEQHFLREHNEWPRVTEKVEAAIDKRAQEKENKLRDVFYWLQTNSCYRKTLYAPFQPGIRQPTGQCCSNCGFSWDLWQPAENEPRIAERGTWQERLNEIFHISE